MSGRWRCDELGLSIDPDGDDLAIVKDGRTFRATRTHAESRPPPPAGSIYQHPTGGEITLPPRWQVTQSQLGLQLVPPDPGYTPQGPSEIYLLSSQPAPGVQQINDPRIVAYVDQAVHQIVPTLGPASVPQPSHGGIVMRWTGRNPQTNAEILTIALLRLVDNSVVTGIIAIGERARVEGRIADLEAIFASFRIGQGRRDPALVGIWHHWSFRMSGAYSSSSSSSETRKAWQLGADGTLVERSSHEGVMSVNSPNVSGGYASQNADGRTGTWTAGDGGFYIVWADGAQAAWQYRIVGSPGARRLVLTSVGQREPYEWTEQRVNV